MARKQRTKTGKPNRGPNRGADRTNRTKNTGPRPHQPSPQRRADSGRGESGRGESSRGESSRGEAGLWLFGFHAVEAALRNPVRRINRLLATPEAAERLSARDIPRDRMTHLEPADRSAIDAAVGPDQVHQGLALKVHPLPALDIHDVLEELPSDSPALVVALDHVTDPHNVGAILRSASAFGACALITTKHNAPEETGVLAKSASGALENVPLVRVTNLSRTIEDCQKLGFWAVGLDADGDTDISQLETPARCVIVLGAEGEGLRPGIRKSCDFIARLPMSGPMESLNVSNAAAVSLYEWQRQHRS